MDITIIITITITITITFITITIATINATQHLFPSLRVRPLISDVASLY